jgi:hypothetical protein
LIKKLNNKNAIKTEERITCIDEATFLEVAQDKIGSSVTNTDNIKDKRE